MGHDGKHKVFETTLDKTVKLLVMINTSQASQQYVTVLSKLMKIFEEQGKEVLEGC